MKLAQKHFCLDLINNMKIYFNTQTYNQINFTSKSHQFRKEYSKRIENNEITATNIKNLQGLAENFSKEGLTYEQCLKASKANPFMLVQKAETMEHNIKECAKIFSAHGVTTEKFLQSALTYPPLFSMSPKTIKSNMIGHSKSFAYDGLSVVELFKSAQTNPFIYTIPPKTFNKKVNKLAQGMEVERADIIEVFKKHPTIISLDSINLIKKFAFLKYIEQNKFFDTGKPLPPNNEIKASALKKSLTNSMELNYLILLRNKISSTLPRGSKLPFDYLDKAINKFIQDNSNKTIELKLPTNKLAKDFTKFVKSFSKSVIGKNIFRFKLV